MAWGMRRHHRWRGNCSSVPCATTQDTLPCTRIQYPGMRLNHSGSRDMDQATFTLAPQEGINSFPNKLWWKERETALLSAWFFSKWCVPAFDDAYNLRNLAQLNSLLDFWHAKACAQPLTMEIFGHKRPFLKSTIQSSDFKSYKFYYCYYCCPLSITDQQQSTIQSSDFKSYKFYYC